MTEATFRYQKARIVVLEEECLRARGDESRRKIRKVATESVDNESKEQT